MPLPCLCPEGAPVGCEAVHLLACCISLLDFAEWLCLLLWSQAPCTTPCQSCSPLACPPAMYVLVGKGVARCDPSPVRDRLSQGQREDARGLEHDKNRHLKWYCRDMSRCGMDLGVISLDRSSALSDNCVTLILTSRVVVPDCVLKDDDSCSLASRREAR